MAYVETLSSRLSVALGLAMLLGGLAAASAADIVLSYSSPNDAASYDGRSNGGAPFVGGGGGGNPANFVMAGMTAEDFSQAGAGSLGALAHVDPGVLAAVRDPATYAQWGWSASPSLDLTTLSVAYGASQFFAEGPRAMDIDVSVNGGAFQTILSGATVPYSTEAIALSVIDLTAFDGVTSATFRAFPYLAEGSGGDLAFFNFTSDGGMYSAIRIEGVAAEGGAGGSEVPEPSSPYLWAVVVAGSSAAFLRARRRRGQPALGGTDV